ncbi:hypothetical protein MSEO_29460 [Mycobacterium seoulense]|uniref:MaoC-like domain-containing protein n=1 Tax=Mycobacterium seoulense TaxID=386911 RepID=A0A7I7P0L9_9MYCO|nr:hypothetical protein [Mycobacterium seoulense]BBY02447.1 hypothetical protein MSEO_29460 [Mycobacterium seoulense]
MKSFGSVDDAVEATGAELGVSRWFDVEQSRIDEFADVTRDHQWTHVDVERVETESPYGATITQGFLTLSLIPGLSMDNYRVENARMGINYGLNPVGFASLPHRRYRAQRGALPRRVDAFGNGRSEGREQGLDESRSRAWRLCQARGAACDVSQQPAVPRSLILGAPAYSNFCYIVDLYREMVTGKRTEILGQSRPRRVA